MADLSVSVSVETGQPRSGAWCGVCLLPSAFEIDLTAMSATGRLAGVTVRTVTLCPEHGQL